MMVILRSILVYKYTENIIQVNCLPSNLRSALGRLHPGCQCYDTLTKYISTFLRALLSINVMHSSWTQLKHVIHTYPISKRTRSVRSSVQTAHGKDMQIVPTIVDTRTAPSQTANTLPNTYMTHTTVTLSFYHLPISHYARHDIVVIVRIDVSLLAHQS